MPTAIHSQHPSSDMLSPAQLVTVGILGALVLLGIGFVPLDWVHSLAHDARHALAMPCH